MTRRPVTIVLVARGNHREAILRAGLQAFYEKGFSATGVQEIVSSAGVPKGSFYNHFESKEALGLAVLDLYWSLAEESREALLDENLPVLKRIDRHFAKLGCPKEGCLVGNFTAELSSDPSFQQHLRSMWRTWISLIADCLKTGQEDGSVRKDMSAHELARFVLLQWQGAVLMNKAEPSADTFVRTRKQLLKYLSP